MILDGKSQGDGTEHRAHTALLSASSSYFRNLLSGSFLEADRVKKNQPVEIAASKGAVTVLLDHIYGGEPEVPVEAGLELLRLAEAYDLPLLAAAIEAGLRASLDSTNALQILQETQGLHSMRDACEEKVAEDFEACSQHPEFGKLSAGQLARILKRRDLKVSREEEVLKSIFNWLNISKDRDVFFVHAASARQFPIVFLWQFDAPRPVHPLGTQWRWTTSRSESSFATSTKESSKHTKFKGGFGHMSIFLVWSPGSPVNMGWFWLWLQHCFILF